MRQSLVIGTRKSKLALWQTNAVREELQKVSPNLDIAIQEFSTRGDDNLSQPLPEIGGKGLFTAELDVAILNGEIDFAVHSLKDLPTTVDDGLSIVPVLSREDVRDVLVTRTGDDLKSLDAGSVIGTSSPRREAQILSLRQDLVCRPIRGNVPTRIRKVRDGEFDAALLAAAGVIRLGLQDEISQWMGYDDVLPAPGQAMIAATCRSSDDFMVTLLREIQNETDVCCVATERLVLAKLGGGCSAPVGALARTDSDGMITLTVRIGLPDGSSKQDVTVGGKDFEHVADRASDLLRKRGARVYLRAKECFAGKRIVVTRGEDQCSEIRSLIRHVGAQGLMMPAISMRAIADVILPPLSKFDWLLFTSQKAVTFFESLVRHETLEVPSELKVACVGSATAEAARRCGFQTDFVSEHSSGDSLANELVAQFADKGGSQPLRFLYPSAAAVASKLVQILEDNGNKVLRVPIYETLRVDLDGNAIEQLRSGVDAITFASPSAVQSFCSQLENCGLLKSVVEDTVFACVGKTTASELKTRCPDAKVTTAEYPSMAALIESLEGPLSGQTGEE